MTKAELVNLIAEKGDYEVKKDAEKALSTVIAAITDALVQGEKIALVGFGTFEVKQKAAREGINPSTKEKISIPARKVPSFKAGNALKAAVAE